MTDIYKDFCGGPLTLDRVVGQPHWLDNQYVCSRCGRTMEDIENFALSCRSAPPDLLALVREVVPACR